MIAYSELNRWLQSLPASTQFAIDGEKLKAVEDGRYTGAELLIGGCTEAEEAALVFVEHKGIRIFRTLNDDDMESPNIFHIEPEHNCYAAGGFDWRDLPDIKARDQSKYRKLFPDPEDPSRSRMPVLQRRVLAQAIDKGWITEEGLRRKKVDQKAQKA